MAFLPSSKILKFHVKNRLIQFKIYILFARKNLLSKAHTHTLLEEERKKQFGINKNPLIRKTKSMSKTFPEFSVQQNRCLFAKPSAKSPNLSVFYSAITTHCPS